MLTTKNGAAVLLVMIVGSCTGLVPNVPSDAALPVKEILSQTVCELREAFNSLNNEKYKRFNAPGWVVSIALLPKADTNLNASVGFTRKSPSIPNPVRLTNWAMSGPGLQADAKGQRSTGVNFTFKSGVLMKDKTLNCDIESPSAHALAQHLGVGDWLRRTASAIDIAQSIEIDKPSFNTDINIKFAANGSYTYTIPVGTDLASLGGSYSLDEQLNISMAPIPPTPPPIKIVTLPSGDRFGPPSTITLSVSPADAVESAKQRTDVMQLEQALRNLSIRP